MVIYEPGSGLNRPQICPSLRRGLPASRTVGNKFLLLISHSAYVTLLKKPEWTKTICQSCIALSTSRGFSLLMRSVVLYSTYDQPHFMNGEHEAQGSLSSLSLQVADPGFEPRHLTLNHCPVLGMIICLPSPMRIANTLVSFWNHPKQTEVSNEDPMNLVPWLLGTGAQNCGSSQWAEHTPPSPITRLYASSTSCKGLRPIAWRGKAQANTKASMTQQ